MGPDPTRREFLGSVAALGALCGAAGRASAQEPDREFLFSLNTSTIRPASLEDKIRIAAEAGYDAVELWIDDLEAHAAAGRSPVDLGRRIADLGLFVPNVIGLWNCMPEADDERPAALEAARRRMTLARDVGARCIAAVPTPDRPGIDPLWAAERYHELLALGREIGIRVAVEFVGFFRGVSRLSQAVQIAIEADDPDACLVADTFHLFRGGSGFGGVRLLSALSIAVFHFNDAPADVPREQQGDGHRVYPGDGHLPLVALLRDLRAIGCQGPLSLELFNRAYWEQDALTVARTGLAKMRAVAEASRAVG